MKKTLVIVPFCIVALSAVSLLAFFPLKRSPRPDYTVVACDMAYFLGTATDQSEANPTLILSPGQSVTILFRNDDPGMEHDFVVPELGVRTRVLKHGEVQLVTLRAPPGPVVLTYLCSVHPQMMRGRLAIR